jgi:hypothetical protein
VLYPHNLSSVDRSSGISALLDGYSVLSSTGIQHPPDTSSATATGSAPKPALRSSGEELDMDFEAGEMGFTRLLLR